MFKISDVFKKSNEISNLLPNILIESAILTRDTVEGLHSARFSGKGETFWQFKEYRSGDNINSIDWRKSASSNKLLVKEKEKETSKFIYFYYDKTKSMSYKSSARLQSKYHVAVLITLVLTRIFLRQRENIFHCKTSNNFVKCSQDLSSFDKNLLFDEKEIDFPNTSLIKEDSLIFIISDFLYDEKILKNFASKLKRKKVNVFIFQILDPMEVVFNIDTHSEIRDMENNSKLLINDINNFKLSYKKKLIDLQANIKALCTNNGWVYSVHNTSNKLKPFILQIIKNLTFKKK